MINFQKLWDTYPTIQGDKAPCKTDGVKNFQLTDWRTWFVISSTFNLGGNFSKSKEIWFWEIQ